MPNDRDPESERLAEALELVLAWSARDPRVSEEEFLAQHEEFRDLLEPLLGRESTADHPPTAPTRAATRLEHHPEHIDRYRVLERLGEGGMGIVYLAEQEVPIRRKVALKLIKVGMDTDALVARFAAERQALALMNHVNIARVLDASATQEGRPYFVMEYVAGTSITDYCDSHRLSTRERLALFLQVCDGVQHAHQKSVIHRDLKPSNIMVSMQEGEATPKIIDFGVAKALDFRLTDQSLHTLQYHVIGTPEYMSPEQASGLDLDTRTDVYALGVMLYELLVGVLPFERTPLVAEILRRIREDDPATPGARLARMGEGVTEVARRRSVDSRTLLRELSGDLEWIALRALEKDRARRYQTASELKSDIERHLRDEPVLAGPPSNLYRMRKFLRRHRASVIAVTLILVSLLGGLTLSTVLYLRSQHNEQRASSEAQLAQKRLDEISRLSDVRTHSDLLARGATLWPELPERERDLERWLRDADGLLLRLDQHRLELQTLRERALPYDEEGQRLDRISHPENQTLQLLEDERNLLDEEIARREEQGEQDEEGKGSRLRARTADLRQRLVAVESEVDRLERVVSTRRSWNFVDATDQWRHETLSKLVADIERLKQPGGLIANIENRLDHARRSARLLEEHHDDWELTRAAIANEKESPKYRGLRIIPQLGLVPIGSDPSSGLWEFAHPRTGEIPKRGVDGKLVVTEKTCLVFVLVPGGTYCIGAQGRDASLPNYDPRAIENESPEHQLSLDAFFLSKHEMTQSQWLEFVGENPSYWNPTAYPNHTLRYPVEQVSGEDCVEMLAHLGLCLPTEAQWEYAARAGTVSPWWTGVAEPSVQGFANLADQRYRDNFFDPKPSEPWDDGYDDTAPVGSFPANGFGFHDTIGNVSEWCLDWYRSYRQPVRSGDGLRMGPDEKGRGGRVMRGGCFHYTSVNARASFRLHFPSINKDYVLGLRPARRLVTE